MKTDFSREELQGLIDGLTAYYPSIIVKDICRALLAEMDKPKVWDGAPENATYTVVSFYESSTHSPLIMLVDTATYTRELPKSRAIEIAEESVSGSDMLAMFNGKPLVNVIADAILKREKELEAGK